MRPLEYKSTIFSGPAEEEKYDAIIAKGHTFQIPHDPRKPPCPYEAGFKATIRRHVPPEPFSIDYEDAPPMYHRQNEPDLTATEWCLKYPPLETPPHPDPSHHELHIVACFRKPNHFGTILVRCRLDGDSHLYVAKIYDGLYGVERFEDTDMVSDLTYVADSNYSVEAAAYEALVKRGVNGKYTPTYYGAWTFQVPVPPGPDDGAPPTVRDVRMILIDWLPGANMDELLTANKHLTLPVEKRLDVMAQMLECACQLKFHGVEHNDWMGRNIMVTGIDDEHKQNESPRVYAIDFNVAYVVSNPRCVRYRPEQPRLPMSPLTMDWASPCYEAMGWLPINFYDAAVFRGWLLSRWGGREDEYAPEIEGRRDRYPEHRYEQPVPDNRIWREDDHGYFQPHES